MSSEAGHGQPHEPERGTSPRATGLGTNAAAPKAVPVDPSAFLNDELAFLSSVGLRRSVRLIDDTDGPWVSMNGRRVLVLCSNDYLGLASDPRVKQAARAAVERWGCGAGASRLISGTLPPHVELEERLADFLGFEAALLFSSGYTANFGAIAALVGPADGIFSDQLNHASIVDGCRLSCARIHVYPHGDTHALDRLLVSSGTFRRRLVITEGLFGMDGDIAPLARLAEIAATHEALLMVDDAHGIGMLGDGGRGVMDVLGIKRGIHLLVGTLGKSLGSGGAFVAGSRQLKDYLLNRARPFIFSTALAPALAAGALASLQIVESEPERRQGLLEKASYLRQGLSSLGFQVLGQTSAILPVLIGDAGATMELSQRLLEEGVYVQGLRPPTVPPGACRLRCSVTATHTRADLDLALTAFAKVRQHR